jgi:hypothetical protein
MYNNTIHFIFKNDECNNDDIISLKYKDNTFYLSCTCCNNNCWHIEQIFRKMYKDYFTFPINNNDEFFFNMFPLDENNILIIEYTEKKSNNIYLITITLSQNQFHFECNCHTCRNPLFKCDHLKYISDKLFNNYFFSALSEEFEMNNLQVNLENIRI